MRGERPGAESVEVDVTVIAPEDLGRGGSVGVNEKALEGVVAETFDLEERLLGGGCHGGVRWCDAVLRCHAAFATESEDGRAGGRVRDVVADDLRNELAVGSGGVFKTRSLP